jgi:calcium-dependent protein kinase
MPCCRLEEVYESHSEIYLVQELCLGGELFDRLDEQPDYHYTEGECARLVKQMLCAVRYIHSRGIIHRDLKLENFLFSSTAPDSELKMIVRISSRDPRHVDLTHVANFIVVQDFGLSKHFTYGEVQKEAVGTPYVQQARRPESCASLRADVVYSCWNILRQKLHGRSGSDPWILRRAL